MRAVLQRVTGATVHVDGKLISRIGPGIVALIGVGVEDTAEEIAPLTQKILSTKLWNEGLTASHIQVPAQYTQADGGEPQAQASTADASSSNETAGDVTAKARAEQVWGGKPWKTNVMDLQGEILCISQFTLHARLSKGTKPDFHKSMVSTACSMNDSSTTKLIVCLQGGEQARQLYTQVLDRLKEKYQADRIKDGAFGEMMQCSLTNDGPVTILIDTAEKK